jgi:hypothetical protein
LCLLGGTWVPDIFCKFYISKNYIIALGSATTEAREKINSNLESLEFLKFLDVGFTEYKNNEILLHKISHRFPGTTKLITG